VTSIQRFILGIWSTIAFISLNVLIADEPPNFSKVAVEFEVVDSVPVLSIAQAFGVQAEIKRAYTERSPSIVRLFVQNEQRNAFDNTGLPFEGGFSGVIIDESGLILTCSHHGKTPGTKATIELADGKRVAGELLGRFQIDNLKPLQVGPDLGLARIAEPGKWPVARLELKIPSSASQVCLAIGYPGVLVPGRPPLLRIGRTAPGLPENPWLQTTTSICPGDSGGPLFDLAGNVIGIASGGDHVGPTKYQTFSEFSKARERLEAGEIVSKELKATRTMQARPPQPTAFIALPDLETQMLRFNRNAIQIMDGPHAIAAGLIVDADGLAITKASLVGSRPEWTCRLFSAENGRMIVKARVIAASAEHDVALMKIEVQNWPAVSWSESRPEMGMIVASLLGRSAGPLSLSIVGAETCEEPARPNDIPQILLSAEAGEGNVPVVTRFGGTTAEYDVYRHLLQPGDVVTSLNGIPIPTIKEYGYVVDRLIYAVHNETDEVNYNLPAQGSFHGDWINIGIRRGTENLAIHVPKVHSVTETPLDWHSNPRSLRREAFPAVFSHDDQVRPEQCGGPVVDLEGNVIGLNIARADTTRTLAIPPDILHKVISELKQQLNDSEAE